MVTPPVFPSPPIAFMGKYSFSYFITGVGSIYLTNDGTTLAWTTTPAEATALGLYSVPGSAPEAFVLQLPDPALQLAAGHALFLSLAGFQPAPNDSYPTATAGPLASATQLVMNPAYLGENLAPFTVPGAGGGHLLAQGIPPRFWIPNAGSIFDQGGLTTTTVSVWEPGGVTPDYECAQLASMVAYGFGFPGANLQFSSLNGAWFIPVLATNANLRHADLTNAAFTVDIIAPASPDDPVSDFSGADLSFARLVKANFTGATLTSANLSGADLSGAVFTGCDLTNANLSGCTIGNADFTGATMVGTNFSGTNVTRATFSAAPVFQPATLVAPTPANPRTSFNGATLNLSTIHLDWTWLDLAGATIIGTVPANLTNMQAQYTVFPSTFAVDGATLDGANFSGATMHGATLTNAQALNTPVSFVGADLTNAKLGGTTTLLGVKLDNAILHGTLMGSVMFDGGSMTGAQMDKGTYLGASSLQGVDLSSAVLSHANFSAANLATAKLSKATIIGTNFGGAYLTGLDFSDVTQNTMAGTDFGSACLLNAVFKGTSVAGVDFTNAVLQGADFTGAAMTGGTELTSAGIAIASGSMQVTPPQGVALTLTHGATKFFEGETDASTICPNAINGPCSAAMWVAPNAPTSWPSGGAAVIRERALARQR